MVFFVHHEENVLQAVLDALRFSEQTIPFSVSVFQSSRPILAKEMALVLHSFRRINLAAGAILPASS